MTAVPSPTPNTPDLRDLAVQEVEFADSSLPRWQVQQVVDIVMATVRPEYERLVADESRYRQQWHAAARDRLAQSQGNAPTEVDTLLRVAQERVAQVEAERDAAIHDLGTMTRNWQELASDWEDEKVAREAAEAKLAELRAELDRMQAAHYRTGRHNHQLVYEQTGDTPSDDDPLVVVTSSPVMGHHVAEALNAYARTAVEVPDA